MNFGVEHRVEPVDGAGVQGLALAGRLGHRVDGHPVVDPARIVTLKEMVGKRGENEVVGPQHVPLETVGTFRVHVGLEHTTHEILCQRFTVEFFKEMPASARPVTVPGSPGCRAGQG